MTPEAESKYGRTERCGEPFIPNTCYNNQSRNASINEGDTYQQQIVFRRTALLSVPRCPWKEMEVLVLLVAGDLMESAYE